MGAKPTAPESRSSYSCPKQGTETVRQVIDWLFRSRRTGKIVIVQVPNAPLLVFFVASVLHRLVDASGIFNVVRAAATTGALVYWAGAEFIRGVNPWRRVLGGGVLAWQILNLAVG